ncbi:MAG: hypothetical protein ACXWKG_18065 [Limisphaerales bacterium]
MVSKQVTCIRQGFRKLTLCVLMLGLFAPLFSNANVRFDAFVGYDGLVPTCAWFPITCELQNDGPGFTADIEISSDQLSGGYSRRVRVELPTGTQKRIFIPVFATHSRFWSAQLVQGRKVIADQPMLRPRKGSLPGMPIVAAISRTVAGVPTFPPIHSNNSDLQPVAARLQPEMFPDNPLALEGINVIYLNSEKALALDVPRAQALMAWLQRGGRLVVAVEQASDINGNPWLRDLMPCKLEGSAVVKDHPELQDWIQDEANRALIPGDNPLSNSTGQGIRPKSKTRSFANNDVHTDDHFEATPLPIVTAKLLDGVVTIGSAENPLAIEAMRGRGKITVLTFSPEREPFLSWTNRDWFWVRTARASDSLFKAEELRADSGRFSTDGIFGAMIDSKQVRKLPLGWLLLLLGGYLVVIGPLDHYWLKKINKQMLTWITFPCYVVVFSGLIYLIGFHLRAGDLELNELNIVDILPDNEQHAVLRGQTYLSIYSPVNAQYPIVGKQTFASFRGEYGGNYGAANERSRANVLQHSTGFEAEAYVPVWTSQLFVSDWLEPGNAPVSMAATRNGQTWSVTITNDSDRAFANAHVVVGGRVHDIGSLAAGKSKTFELDDSKGTPVQQFTQRYIDTFRNAVQQRNQSFGGNSAAIDSVPRACVAASFVSQANVGGNAYSNFNPTDGLDLSSFANNATAILFAWDEGHSYTQPFNQFKAGRSHRNTMLRLVQPVKNQI